MFLVLWPESCCKLSCFKRPWSCPFLKSFCPLIVIGLAEGLIWSLPYHIDEFTELLSDLKINFKIIEITESRLTTKKDPMNNINISGYNTEHTPTKSNKVGALLYISKELNYKSRNDLKLNKDKNLASVFIEVLSKSDKNTII